MRRDVYERVTDQILCELERGVRPWAKPWSGGASPPIGRPLRSNGIRYRGINVLTLWVEAVRAGFTSPIWITFKQAQQLGGHVRKNAHGSLVVYASESTRPRTDTQTVPEAEQRIAFMKGYTVFNAEQVDGLPPHFYARPEPVKSLTERIVHADAFAIATGAVIAHGGSRAYYAASTDRIQMPSFDAFRDRVSYYGTLIHELTHWTRHKSRLDREFGQQRFGDEGYAMEELVAELGAAFLCADLGLKPNIRDDHAPYLASWLKVLKNDKRAIFSAASHAQRAADYLHGLQPQPEPLAKIDRVA